MTPYEQQSLFIQEASLWVYTATLVAVVVSAAIAFIQHRQICIQAKFDRTATTIANFLEGPWLLAEDRVRWNHLMQAMTEEVFRFDGTFNASVLGDGSGPPSASIDELFTEGPYSDFGSAVVNVVSVLNHVAAGVLSGVQDSDLVWLRLGRFLQMAHYFSGWFKKYDGPGRWRHIERGWQSANVEARYQGQWTFPDPSRTAKRLETQAFALKD